MRHYRGTKGFTLIELMIVVVIIGILAAIAIPKFSNMGNQAKQKEAEGIVKQVFTLQEAYTMRYGSPATDWGVVNATTGVITPDPSLASVGWQAPILKHFQLAAAPTLNATTPFCLLPRANETTLVSVGINHEGIIATGSNTACPTAYPAP
jgi:prepilin-type N-terminal cleavage/methylation domain-containing protein